MKIDRTGVMTDETMFSYIANSLFRCYNNQKKTGTQRMEYMKKRICGLLLGILCSTAITGCEMEEKMNSEDTEPQKVELVVWGAEEDTELMNQIIENFQIKYQNQADLQISYEVQGEAQCKDALIGGLEDGSHRQQGEHGHDRPIVYMTPSHIKINQWLKYVRYEASNEEGQQGVAQIIHKPDHAGGDSQPDQQPHHAVKRPVILLFLGHRAIWKILF